MNVLVDFDDSFTFNLKQYLENAGVSVAMVHWKNFLSFDFEKVKTITLGPGPGHPRDYGLIRNQLKTIIKEKKIKIFGVCLGHQIVCDIFGFELKYLYNPIHGLSKKIYLNSYFKSFFEERNISAQFYNSLFVSKNSKGEFSEFIQIQELGQMLAICRTRSTLSMQFHPESIGSSSTLKGVKKFFE